MFLRLRRRYSATCTIWVPGGRVILLLLPMMGFPFRVIFSGPFSGLAVSAMSVSVLGRVRWAFVLGRMVRV